MGLVNKLRLCTPGWTARKHPSDGQSLQVTVKPEDFLTLRGRSP